ncbi:MAG: HAMP domain-containing protein [Anaerolineae bacterium]|nr:HAMP domain-containing protein [Anaerolineae bacterium]
MSIRLRLTLIYTAILALLLLVINVMLYVGQTQAMVRGDQFVIKAEASRIMKAWPIPPPSGGGQIPPDGGPMPPERFREIYVQTRSLDGEVVQTDANLGGLILPFNRKVLLALQQGERPVETVTLGSEDFLVYHDLLRKPDTPRLIIQVAMPLSHRARFLTTFRTTLLAASAIILGGVFGVSWVLAGLALRPIHRITQTAQEIGAQRDFNRRVDHAGPNDEIGQLATTFNGMLNELQDAYVQVEQSLQNQQRFVADASHELRTPLTTLRGNLGLLQRQPPISTEDRADVLEDMVDETERLMRLVNDLLILARADAKRPLRNESIALKPLVTDITDQVKLLAPHRALVCDPCPEEATITGDEDALKQILLVLLDNALKHTPPQATITLTTSVDDEHVNISVRDNGPGIEPERLPHIFDRFYRSDDARTEGGTGLGLAIAKELTEAQNGTIKVASEAGQGSVFTLIFPGAKEATVT